MRWQDALNELQALSANARGLVYRRAQLVDLLFQNSAYAESCRARGKSPTSELSELISDIGLDIGQLRAMLRAFPDSKDWVKAKTLAELHQRAVASIRANQPKPAGKAGAAERKAIQGQRAFEGARRAIAVGGVTPARIERDEPDERHGTTNLLAAWARASQSERESFVSSPPFLAWYRIHGPSETAERDDDCDDEEECNRHFSGARR